MYTVFNINSRTFSLHEKPSYPFLFSNNTTAKNNGWSRTEGFCPGFDRSDHCSLHLKITGNRSRNFGEMKISSRNLREIPPTPPHLLFLYTLLLSFTTPFNLVLYPSWTVTPSFLLLMYYRARLTLLQFLYAVNII